MPEEDKNTSSNPGMEPVIVITLPSPMCFRPYCMINTSGAPGQS